MLEIKVYKDNGAIDITNDTYNNVVCTDINLAPDIGVEYQYLQWNDAIWADNYYVDMNNSLFAFTDAMIATVAKAVVEWVQPLGQEGNPTLEQAKVIKLSKLNESFNKAVSSITTALPHEMISWRKQENEARAYTADSTVATPFIDAQLITRDLGETKDELVAKIIANADAYQVAYASLLGKFQNLANKISIATAVEDLAKVVW